jgi:(p)ppGpp synthase/HD superfamily hydrolase
MQQVLARELICLEHSCQLAWRSGKIRVGNAFTVVNTFHKPQIENQNTPYLSHAVHVVNLTEHLAALFFSSTQNC